MNWHEAWVMLGMEAAACAAVMAALWGYATAVRDASIVDVAWSGLLGALAVTDAALAPGLPGRRLMIGIMGGLWGLRLFSHLLVDRVLKARAEDGRYQQLRADWGTHATRNFFVFFQAQGLLAALLSLPFLMTASIDTPLSAIDYAAAALWLVGFCGETLADRQLAAWRRHPEHQGRTCRAGLWRYSRHPNYFCEWLMWCSYAMAALAAPFGWAAALAPLLMLFLIMKVTGIPPTEERAVRSRGDDYRQYQRTTSAFFPWLPRKDQAEGVQA